MGTNILAATKRAGLTGDDAVRAMARAMRPVTSYGDVGVEDGETGLSVGRVPGFGHGVYVGTAFIAEKPPGGADFADPRYWLTPIVPVATSDGGGVRAFGTAPDPDSTAYLVGTNLPELAPGSNATGTDPVTGCHLLSPGVPVHLYRAVDDLGNEVYVFARDPSPVRVRATTAIAAGRYNGKAQKDPTADVPTTGALAAGDMGTDGASVVLLYPPEVGGSSADLPLNKVYLGDLTRVNADGTAVLTLAGGGTGGKPTYFPVRVQSDGGGPFVPGGGATYTYALYPIGSTSGGVAKNADGTTDSDMGQSPAWARQPFWASAATHGTAYYAADGKLTLYQVDEVYGDELCDTATGG